MYAQQAKKFLQQDVSINTMKIKPISFFLGSVIVCSSQAIAADISYRFLQASYISSEMGVTSSTPDVDGTGFVLNASIPINEDINFIAEIDDQTYDVAGTDLDLSYTAIGVNYYTPIFSGIDLGISLSLLSADADFLQLSADDNGNLISLDFRKIINDKYEVGLAVSRFDVFDDTINRQSLSFLVSTPHNSQLVIEFSNSDNFEGLSGDISSISIGLRANYK